MQGGFPKVWPDITKKIGNIGFNHMHAMVALDALLDAIPDELVVGDEATVSPDNSRRSVVS
jgi:hypothetical protein